MFFSFTLVLPRITPFSFEDNPLHEGQFVEIHCSVSEGDLPLTIEWSLNGNDLSNYPEVSTSKIGKRTSILIIESVSYSNAGNYTCKVSNKAGESTHSAELQVNGYHQLYFVALLLLQSFFYHQSYILLNLAIKNFSIFW